MQNGMTRREALGSLAVLVAGAMITAPVQAAAKSEFKVANFSADVTPPLGHPLLPFNSLPALKVDDPLFAHGCVLIGGDKPLVFVSIDWLEIRNDAYERWQTVLAEAAGTIPERVLVSSIHQHDAPMFDLEAQRILEQHNSPSRICSLDFHEKAVQNTARAMRESLQKAQPVTHYGIGQAKAERLASSRRYITEDGKPSYGRSSASKSDYQREQPEGTIDPWLKTLSFWNGDQAVVAISSYAVHPQSYYRTGRVSADFPGLARKKRQDDDAQIHQVYFSGASGNVTVGKYNDGSPENRPLLIDRLYQAMVAAWKNTKRFPLERADFRSVQVRLEPRSTPGYTLADLQADLKPDRPTDKQGLAALGLSWRKKADAGFKLTIPLVDFGAAQFVLLPAESYVEFQLLAQKLRPDSFVMVAGYGECGPGYIFIEQAWEEGNQDVWGWVDPGCEKPMTEALQKLMKSPK